MRAGRRGQGSAPATSQRPVGLDRTCRHVHTLAATEKSRREQPRRDGHDARRGENARLHDEHSIEPRARRALVCKWFLELFLLSRLMRRGRIRTGQSVAAVSRHRRSIACFLASWHTGGTTGGSCLLVFFTALDSWNHASDPSPIPRQAFKLLISLSNAHYAHMDEVFNRILRRSALASPIAAEFTACSAAA